MTQPQADQPGTPRPDGCENALTPASRGEHGGHTLQVSVGQSSVTVQDASGGHSGRKLVSNAMPVSPGIPVTVPRLLRRKWLVAMVFMVGSAVSLPYIWYTMKPNYLANGVLWFKPEDKKLAFDTDFNGVLLRYGTYVNTQVTVIKSAMVLGPVLQRSEIKETEWYRAMAATLGPDTDKMIPALQAMVDATPRRGTELLDVSMQLPYPDSAAKLINAVMDEYVKYAHSQLKGEEEWLAEALTKASTGLQKKIAGLIATKYNLAKRIGTIDSASLGLQLAQQLNVLEAEDLRLKHRLEMAQWEISKFSTVDGLDGELVEGDDASDLGSLEDTAHQYPNDLKWQELFNKLEKTRYDLDVARQRFGERHPDVRQLLMDLEFGERMLREREVQLDEQWSNSRNQALQPVNLDQRAMLKQYAKRTEQEILLVREEIDRQRARVADIGDIALELAQYEEQIKNNRETHELIRKRLEALQMEATVPPARIQTAAKATVPGSPYKDRRKVLSVASVVGALVGGLVLAYLRASTDKTIYDAAEIQRMYRIPLLGMLPQFKGTDMPREYGGLALASGDAEQERYLYPRHVLIESMRSIRTTLLERMPQPSQGVGQVLLITSALPRTGKTTVAHLLSESLAMVGKRVLLVEADVHKPVLAKRMGMEKGLGLAALLSGGIDVAQAIRPSGQANLDVLFVGEHPADFDSESMASSAFLSYLDQWKQNYDIIILDSPPVLVTADTLILAGYANSTLLVLRSSHDRTVEAAECYSQLVAAGGKPIGTLMIGGQFMPYRRYGGYKYGYSYGYRYWYKYGHDYVRPRSKNRSKTRV